MATRMTFPLLPVATRTTSKTGDWLDTQASPLRNAFLNLYVLAGGSSGTTPTLNCRIVGGPKTSSSYYTSVYCFSAKGTGPQSGRGGFAQATTAGKQFKMAAWLPRYIQAISTIAGSSPSFNYGVFVDAESD